MKVLLSCQARPLLPPSIPASSTQALCPYTPCLSRYRRCVIMLCKRLIACTCSFRRVSLPCNLVRPRSISAIRFDLYIVPAYPRGIGLINTLYPHCVSKLTNNSCCCVFWNRFSWQRKSPTEHLGLAGSYAGMLHYLTQESNQDAKEQHSRQHHHNSYTLQSTNNNSNQLFWK